MWRNKKRKKGKRKKQKQQINTENVAILPSRKLLSWSTSPRERERERRALRIYRMVEGVWSDINKVVFFVVVVGIVVVCCPRESPVVVVRRHTHTHTQQVNSLLSPIKVQYIGPWRTAVAAATALSNHLLLSFLCCLQGQTAWTCGKSRRHSYLCRHRRKKNNRTTSQKQLLRELLMKAPPQMWLTWLDVPSIRLPFKLSFHWVGGNEIRFESEVKKRQFIPLKVNAIHLHNLWHYGDFFPPIQKIRAGNFKMK
jgi:hypothetical protein